MPRDEEFIKRLLSIFKVEASEHISSISSGLFRLEKNISQQEKQEIIEIIYRSAHSLKGASRSVNLSDVESLCQSMEDLLALLQRGGIVYSEEIQSILHESNDLLTEMIGSDEPDLSSEKAILIQSLKERMAKAANGFPRFAGTEITAKNKEISGNGDQTPDTEVHEIEPVIIPDRRKRETDRGIINKQTRAAAETIRVSASKLETLLMKSEELVTVKLTARHYESEIDEILLMLARWSKEWVNIFRDFKKYADGNNAYHYGSDTDEERKYAALVKKFIEFNESLKSSFENKLYSLRKTIDEDSRSSGALINDVLSDMKNILLMPFSYTLEAFPKIVRDISKEQDKNVELILEGTDVEVDKRVLQEMKDPFMHLIRNSIDHGIETPAMRKKAGKQEKGLIIISINQIDAGRVGITISDDGAGIDHEKVRSAALAHGVISEAENDKITDEDVVNLIFESGVSTSPIITTVSGRGLGMAIVKEKTEKLGGSVKIRSAAGKGTEFNIILPVAIATFRGILIESGGQMFVVPTKNVEKMSRVHISEIKTVENKETVTFNGNAVSLVKLDDILEIQSPVKKDAEEYINIMIVPSSGRYIAFIIDRVLNEDEMLLKNLGRQLKRVRNISGATVLASGQVVPIINTSDIVKSASRIRRVSPAGVLNTMPDGKSGGVKSILVVEDSITARSLYVNILEAVGYRVSSAVDGIDGFTKLINGDFDLVLTDVQMPKMNGFELTEKIRGDKRYGNIPVVLVTGMESADDKRRGIDSGANAYVVKSSFDQNNLLEIIERFI